MIDMPEKKTLSLYVVVFCMSDIKKLTVPMAFLAVMKSML
jgi:hypothetical protein